jgi:hypothetical protein
MELPPDFRDSTEKYRFGGEDIEMNVYQFCSQPEAFIQSILIEGNPADLYRSRYDEAGNLKISRSDITYLLQSLNNILETLFATRQVRENGEVILQPFITDPDIITIVAGGRDSEGAMVGLLRLLKRANIPKDTLIDYFSNAESEGTAEEKLFLRGIPVRIEQVFSEDLTEREI